MGTVNLNCTGFNKFPFGNQNGESVFINNNGKLFFPPSCTPGDNIIKLWTCFTRIYIAQNNTMVFFPGYMVVVVFFFFVHVGLWVIHISTESTVSKCPTNEFLDQLSFCYKTWMEFFYWHWQPSAVMTAPPTRQWMSACKRSATWCILSEGENWGAKAQGQKFYTISCSFPFSVFHWATFPFHKSIQNVQIRVPEAFIMFPFSAAPTDTHSQRVAAYLSWSIECL